jgi:GT2 family glycosyltransferase
MVYGKMIFIDDHGNTIKNRSGAYPEFFGRLSTKEKLEVYCRNAEFVNIPTWFVTRELVQRMGGYDESYFLLEDQVSIVRALALGAKVLYLEKELIKYRIHTSSTIIKFNKLLLSELLRARREERNKHLSKSIKNLMYMVDDNMHLTFASSKYKKVLYCLRLVNPAFYFKMFIVKMPNTGMFFRLKKWVA